MRKYQMQFAPAGDHELRITRKFDAPRALVFAAMTQVDLIREWFGGPPGWTLDHVEFEARAGGAYRYVWKNGEGARMGMGGKILEFVPPERMVTTEKFDEPWYPGEARSIMEFTEQDGVTTLRLTIRYALPEAREVVRQSPMEQGMAAGYDSLEDYLGMANA